MIRQRILALRERQLMARRKVDQLVMSEYNYIILRGEIYLQSYGDLGNKAEDIVEYYGMKIIRLDVADDTDILFVG